RSSAISKLRFSPTTIRGISYSRAVPEHMMHGERVVYSTDSRYTLARRRPAFSIVSVSPCRIAESFCTRWLWPAASTSPSWTSTAPIGTPPSSQLFVACSMARARKRRSSSAVGVQVMGWMLLRSSVGSHGIVEGNPAASLERCDPGNSPRSPPEKSRSGDSAGTAGGPTVLPSPPMTERTSMDHTPGPRSHRPFPTAHEHPVGAPRHTVAPPEYEGRPLPHPEEDLEDQ